MNGFWLVLPLLIIRFGLLSILNKKAVQRAGYYAPVQGGEVLPSYIYQVSNVALFLYLFWTKIGYLLLYRDSFMYNCYDEFCIS